MLTTQKRVGYKPFLGSGSTWWILSMPLPDSLTSSYIWDDHCIWFSPLYQLNYWMTFIQLLLELKIWSLRSKPTLWKARTIYCRQRFSRSIMLTQTRTAGKSSYIRLVTWSCCLPSTDDMNIEKRVRSEPPKFSLDVMAHIRSPWPIQRCNHIQLICLLIMVISPLIMPLNWNCTLWTMLCCSPAENMLDLAPCLHQMDSKNIKLIGFLTHAVATVAINSSFDGKGTAPKTMNGRQDTSLKTARFSINGMNLVGMGWAPSTRGLIFPWRFNSCTTHSYLCWCWKLSIF